MKIIMKRCLRVKNLSERHFNSPTNLLLLLSYIRATVGIMKNKKPANFSKNYNIQFDIFTRHLKTKR